MQGAWAEGIGVCWRFNSSQNTSILREQLAKGVKFCLRGRPTGGQQSKNHVEGHCVGGKGRLDKNPSNTTGGWKKKSANGEKNKEAENLN